MQKQTPTTTDYDLVDTDNDCLNNISGALLDMYLWALNKPLAKLP